jgi:hypothetical protein
MRCTSCERITSDSSTGEAALPLTTAADVSSQELSMPRMRMVSRPASRGRGARTSGAWFREQALEDGDVRLARPVLRADDAPPDLPSRSMMNVSGRRGLVDLPDGAGRVVQDSKSSPSSSVKARIRASMPGSSTLTATIRRPLGPSRSWSRCIDGISIRQGPHQVAQTLSSTTSPSYDLMPFGTETALAVPPAPVVGRVTAEKSGASPPILIGNSSSPRRMVTSQSPPPSTATTPAINSHWFRALTRSRRRARAERRSPQVTRRNTALPASSRRPSRRAP